MKAVCYARSWIEEITARRGEQYTARVLIVNGGDKEDPTQNTAFVNSIFACQKLKINVDSLVLKYGQSTQSSSHGLLKQASFLTHGIAFEAYDPKKVLPILLEVFSSNVDVRQRLLLPVAEPGKDISMSSTCTLCNGHTKIGYACSYCLALYCAPSPDRPRQACHTVPHCLNCGKEVSKKRL